MATNDLTGLQYGVGPIGCAIVRTAHAAGIDFIGGVDIDPDKVGTGLGETADLGREINANITDDYTDIDHSELNIAFHSTVSSIDDALPQLEELLSSGVNVVSTCEELAYPWYTHSQVAEEIDKIATENSATCIGTGINPGFIMDTLPAVASVPCQDVDSIKVRRIQDAGSRRVPLQEKIGVGYSVDKFEREIAGGGGHVGLPESIAMLASAFGWDIDDMEEQMDPVVADTELTEGYTTVEPGDVAGIEQVATASSQNGGTIELHERMYVNAVDPRDHIEIQGTPEVSLEVRGYHGDVTTPAVVVNVAQMLDRVSPGLKTMIDIPLPSYLVV